MTNVNGCGQYYLVSSSEYGLEDEIIRDDVIEFKDWYKKLESRIPSTYVAHSYTSTKFE
jgi:hypothetical protein